MPASIPARLRSAISRRKSFSSGKPRVTTLPSTPIGRQASISGLSGGLLLTDGDDLAPATAEALEVVGRAVSGSERGSGCGRCGGLGDGRGGSGFHDGLGSGGLPGWRARCPSRASAPGAARGQVAWRRRAPARAAASGRPGVAGGLGDRADPSGARALGRAAPARAGGAGRRGRDGSDRSSPGAGRRRSARRRRDRRSTARRASRSRSASTTWSRNTRRSRPRSSSPSSSPIPAAAIAVGQRGHERRRPISASARPRSSRTALGLDAPDRRGEQLVEDRLRVAHSAGGQARDERRRPPGRPRDRRPPGSARACR